ncbi:MAG: DUF2934 domain-containing protein [Gammaproteobacteria bacterium]
MANTSKTGTTRATKTTPAKKTLRTAAPARKSRSRAGTTDVSPEIRQQMIAEAAYLRAERRGFAAGDPVDDWLAAEREVDLLLAERPPQLTQ